MNQQPTLHNVDVRCASCGTSFEIRTTAEALSIDVCSTCHPAYTGRERKTVTERPDRSLQSSAAHSLPRSTQSSAVSFGARKVDSAASPAAKLFSASQPPSTVSAMPFTYADWSLAR